jgi:hypothetical protein
VTDATALTLLGIYTDGIRWMAALAGYIILGNVVRGYVPAFYAARDKWAKLFFGLFLVIAGTVIPISRRWPPLGYYTVLFNIIVAIFWTFAAMAGWSGLIGRAQRPWAMVGTAGLLLAGTTLAAALTDVS